MGDLDPFRAFREEPVIVLTGDQDWCPDWALAATLALVKARGVPFHLFVTNPSTLLGVCTQGLLSLGIHPNFLEGSTHGSSAVEVIDACRSLVPAATSFRCHAYHENSHILATLRERGFTTDSNLLTFLQPSLTPLIHGTGLLRLPVFFEDDVFIARAGPELDLALAVEMLLTPGLKILDFHPAHVAQNTPSMEFYESRRGAFYGDAGARERFPGRGAAVVLEELIDAVLAADLSFTTYEAVATLAHEALRSAFPKGLYGQAGT